MSLAILIFALGLGTVWAFETEYLSDLFGALVIGVIVSLFCGLLFEGLSGYDEVEYRNVETVECFVTDDGLVVLADNKLYEDGQYDYTVEHNRIATYHTYSDWGSWPWTFLDWANNRLEFTGCPN